MKIKRYFAQDMRQALRQVREAQGPDAVILSNRKVDGGVEVVAAVDYDEAQFFAQAEAERPADPFSGPQAGGDGGLPQDLYRAPPEPAQATRKKGADQAVVWSREPAMEAMREELNNIRSLLEQQLSGLAWGELGRRKPQRAALLRQLLELGLGAALAREIAAKAGDAPSLQAAWRKALTLLAQRVQVSDDGILTHGGVVALVGPTGVGKTTTAAKLAARFAMRHGPDQVALVTTDTYRVGAVEQLRTYGRIMNVPVRVTHGRDELHAAIGDLGDRRLILIDTAGMSQRDVRLSEHLAGVSGGSSLIQIYLVLSATNQLLGLDEAVRAFRSVPLDGCIVTKVDEATGLGGVISTLVHQQLTLAYVSTGQRVPEDIQSARAHALVAKAVSVMQQHSRNHTDESVELAYGAMAADGSL